MNNIYSIILFLFISSAVYAQPIVNLGNDTTVCSGNSVTLNAGNPGAAFLWSTGATTQTITVSTSGTYWVDVTNGGTTRDSISLIVLLASNFSANDTIVCSGFRTLQLQNSNPQNFYIWWNALVGGSTLNTGLNYSSNFTAATTVFVSEYTTLSTNLVGLTDNTGYSGDYYAFNDGRGTQFDVIRTAFIDSLTFYSNAAVSFTLELRNSANTLINSRIISVPAAGTHRISAGFLISPGSGYKLLLADRVGGAVYCNTGLPGNFYPTSGSVIQLSAAIPASNNFFYFYNWRVKELGCETPRDPMNVNIIPAPVSTLPTDSSHCGNNLTISVLNPGSTYLWSTGSTTSSITITQNGTYHVEINNGACTLSDTINALLLPTSNFTANDTVLCNGNATLQLQNSDAQNFSYLWWDAPVSGTLVNIGPTYNNNFSSSTSYYIESKTNNQRVYAGLSNNTSYSGSHFFFSDPRGTVFDVTEEIILDSVLVYLSGALSFDIQLRNSADAVIFSKNFSRSSSGSYRLQLGYFIVPGNGYKLVIANMNGSSGVFCNTGLPGNFYPTSSSLPLRLTSAIPASNNYFYFYNWTIQTLKCGSLRDAMNISVLPAPQINLPTDTIHCGNSITLDVSFTGATYTWSNGSTNSTANFSQSGSYWASVSNGACEVNDSFNLTLIAPSQYSANDTVICSGVNTISLSNANSQDFTYLWWDSPSGGNIFHIGPNYQDTFLSDTNYYIESKTNYLKEYAGLANNSGFGGAYFFFADARGSTFNVYEDIMLDSVDVYVGGSVSFDIQLRNSADIVLYSKNFSLANLGLYRLALRYLIQPGSGYKLVIANMNGGSGVFCNTGLPANFYPTVNSTSIQLTSAIPSSNNYFYFYNWVVNVLKCGTQRDPMSVSVLQAPTLNLPSDTVHCGNSLSLDVSFPGADYLWSNGSTSSLVSLGQEGSYWVNVSNGVCSVSDSFDLTLFPNSNFIASDTNVCSGIHNLSLQNVNNNSYSYLWWDNSVGGNLLHIGTTYRDSFYSGTNLYVESKTNFLFENAGLITNQGFSGSHYSFSDARGTRFNVLNELILDSVNVYVNGNITFEVQLKNNADAIINSKSFTLSGSGNFQLPLSFLIQPGNDYKLLIANMSGASVYCNTGLPANFYPTSNTLSLQLTGAIPSSNNYFFFYNWILKSLKCSSPRQELSVNVLPSPVINLPADTLHCGSSLTLDVSFPGANYNWSNGTTNPTITLTPADLINIPDNELAVSVDFSGCIASDTISIAILDTARFIISDTTACGGNIGLNIQNLGQDALFFWWDSPTGGQLLGQGSNYMNTFYDSTTLYVEGRPIFKSNNVGILNPSLQDYQIYNTRGLNFDVINEIIIDSLTIYTGSIVNTTLEIRSASNQLIFSKALSLVSGANLISVDAVLSPANDYKIQLLSPAGGFLVADLPVTYPLSFDDIVFRSGFPFSTHYNYFYNWKIRRPACPSTREAVNINILPTKNINWPVDTILCSGSVVLDLSFPNSSYLWSNGQTGSSITVSTVDTVWAEVTTGSCISRDTLLVFLSTPPTQLIAPSDTLVCGGLLNLSVSGNAATYAWYSIPTGGLPIAYGNQIGLNLSDSVNIYVEGLNLLRSGNVFGHQTVPTVNGAYTGIAGSNYPSRGLLFDIYKTLSLDEVSIFSNGPLSAEVILLNEFGIEINRRTVNLLSGGEHVILLNWILEPGINYSLWLEDVQGAGQLYIVSNYGFPLSYSELQIKNGLPQALSNQYNSFYKWKISTPTCATSRQAVRIDVPEYPNISMPSDTAICNGNSALLSSTDGTQNYSYLWNNGAVTNSITATTAGTYSVTVTNNGCSSVKNSLVQFPTNPASPQIADSSICNPSLLNLLENPLGGIVLWTDPFGTVQNISAPYSIFIEDSSTFTVEYAAKAQTRLGSQSHPNPSDISRYEGFIISNTFDIQKPAVLDSVAVYFDAVGTFDVVLSDFFNNELGRRTVTVNSPFSKVFLPLNFVLMPANGYQLFFENIAGAQFLVDRFVTYPQSSSSSVASLTGTPFSGISYNCFYDWHFSYALDGCYASSNDNFTINVSLPVSLPDSVFTCTDVQLDAAVPAAVSYIWNTGATTSVILANQSGLYTVTVSDGASCSYIASTEVATPDEIIFDDNNGAICGNLLGTNYDNNNQFVWSTGSTNPQLTVNNPGFYALSILTEEGCVVNDSILISTIETPPAVNIGDVLNICSGATLDAGFGNQGMTYLWNNGATTQTIEVSASGTYAVTVTSQTGCDGSDFVFVNEIQPPLAGFNYTVSGNAVAFTSTATSTTSVLWLFGDNTSTTLLNPFHLYQGPGCYQVTQIATNSCGSDTIVRYVPLGVDPAGCGVTAAIQTFSEADINIIPNPNNGIFKVQLADNLFPDKIEVFDISGKIIFSEVFNSREKSIDINLENIPSGIYILVCHDDGSRLIKKVAVSER